MKIFDSGSGWDTKVNFVDENNVFVGYDTMQDCCEYAGWFIDYDVLSDISYSGLENKENSKKPDTDGYIFDIEFLKEEDDGDETGVVIFKLKKDKESDLYLHLFNVHNGYYSHGFEFSTNEVIIKKGYL